MIRKTIVAAGSALAVIGAAGTAIADSSREAEWYVGEAPTDVRDMNREGPVTVAGFVRLPHRSGVVLDDGTGAISIDLEHLRQFWPDVGEEVTVLGDFDDGHIEAYQIIRKDGTVGRSFGE